MLPFLRRFWVVLIPFLLFALWWRWAHRNGAASETLSKRETQLWYVTLAASVVIALCVVVFYSAQNEPDDRVYQPSRYEDGKIVPPTMIERK